MLSFPLRPRKSWLIAGSLALVAGLTGVVLWLNGVVLFPSDPLFRGKPESQWIANLKYWDDEQVKEWRSYGKDGVQVLSRGLEKANRPGERMYRRYYRRIPYQLSRWLPSPKQDSTRQNRMCLVSLLSSLGKDARSAVPVMLRTVQGDEADDVRQIAIGFFNTSEDEKCLLNELPARQKRALLPALLRAVQNPSNWGLRNNAAISLRFYPEEREVVAPILVNTLRDAKPQVRVLAAVALNRVAPDVARKAGTTPVLVAVTKDPDPQIAYRAVEALGKPGNDADLAVSALVECLQSTNTLIACQAVWSLEWAPKEFHAYSEKILPALQTAGQRKDNVGGYARNALNRWPAEPNGRAGAK